MTLNNLSNTIPSPETILRDIIQWSALLTKECIFHLEKSVTGKEITVLEEVNIDVDKNEKRLLNYKKLITLLYIAGSKNKNKDKFNSIFNPGKIVLFARVLDENKVPFLNLNAVMGTRDQISSLLILKRLLKSDRVEKLERLEEEIIDLYSNPINIEVITLFGTYQNRIKALDFIQQIEKNSIDELVLQAKLLEVDTDEYDYLQDIIEDILAVDELREDHTATPQLSLWLNLLLMTLIEKDLIFPLE